MAFISTQKNINSILSGNFEYIIPKNQRKYIWNTNEWDELFEDIFEIEQSLNYCHFIGSFVFSETKNSSNKFEIIDGQQRLITITVLFCVIANKYNEIGETKKANSIFNSFIIGNIDGDDYFKVSRNEEHFFLSTLCSCLKNGYKTESEIRKEYESSFKLADSYNLSFLNCFLHFTLKVDSYIKNKRKAKLESLSSLVKKLSEVEAIEIKVNSEVDGYRIFETLNARGIPLEQHELIKNFIYSYMRTKAGQEKVFNTWNKITSNLTNVKADYFNNFIRHYCIHAYGKIKRNTEFKTIRLKTNKNDVESLLNSLSSCSKFYGLIINPDKLKETKYYSDKAFTSLIFFKKMNIMQVRPLLLSLFECFDEEKMNNETFGKSLEILEIFYFIYLILGKQTTNIIDSSISSLALKIHDEKNCDILVIKNVLSPFLPSFDLAKANFVELGYSHHNKKFSNTSNKRIIDYIFSKIESSFCNNDEHSAKIPSIEHIMDDANDINDACLIGNLLPLSTTLNNKCKGKNFSNKLKIYSQSSYNLCKKFVEYNANKSEWTVNDILERSKRLADKYFIELWWRKIINL